MFIAGFHIAQSGILHGLNQSLDVWQVVVWDLDGIAMVLESLFTLCSERYTSKNNELHIIMSYRHAVKWWRSDEVCGQGL